MPSGHTTVSSRHVESRRVREMEIEFSQLRLEAASIQEGLDMPSTKPFNSMVQPEKLEGKRVQLYPEGDPSMYPVIGNNHDKK